MPGGTLSLSYGTTTISVSVPVTISESMQKSCTVVPLVSMGEDNTFAVESRSSKTIRISFQRVQPASGMTNADWIRAMEEAVNRWQCRTDGFRLRYVPDSDNPYVAPIDENGYIKSFSYRFAKGEPTRIVGDIEFHVGTMYCGSQARHTDSGKLQSDFRITMTDKNGVASYTLLGNNLKTNCVESYTLSGGPESPFEFLKMVIPRNRLSEVASALTEEDGIVAGRNLVTIDAVGQSNMTVTKCKLNDSKYTITAYCNADKLRGVTLDSPIEGTPDTIIRSLLNRPQYGVTYVDDALVMEHQDIPAGNIRFSAGKNVWYVLQVAAMYMGCRIFFANNHAYVVDYRNENSSVIDSCGDIELYPSSGNVSFTVNKASLGDEGMDTVVNKLQLRATISATDDDGNPTYTDNGDGTYSANTTVGTIPITVRDEESNYYEMFGERTGNVISVEDLTNLTGFSIEVEGDGNGDGEVGEDETMSVSFPTTTQATTFGQNYIDYRKEPQQSIEFTVMEMFDMGNGPEWIPTYLPIARADSINDSMDEVIITNKSDLDGDKMYQKLCLSTFEKNFPEGTTTYTWGVMASIDLSSSTSQIYTSLDNS